MTTAECYALIGADYTEVLRRMGNEDRVRRFLLKFAEEPSYGLLCRSVEAGDAKEAFRAAHSIKGVCLNLGLTACTGPPATCARSCAAALSRTPCPACSGGSGRTTRKPSTGSGSWRRLKDLKRGRP